LAAYGVSCTFAAKTGYNMETNHNYLMVTLQLLGSLGLLIYGMRLMSEALQKMAGPQLRHILGKMTTNRLPAC
jgi:phosphate:Na+ symporter